MSCDPTQLKQISSLLGTIPIQQQTPCLRMVNTHSGDFRAWFGDSRVVDEAGEPLLVFHGSPVRDIRNFDRKGSIGVFFTTDPKLAASYAQQAGTVYPTYLSIQNPLYWSEAETEAFQDWLLRRLLEEEETPWEVIEDYNTYVTTHEYEDLMPLGEEGLSQAIDELLKFAPRQVDYRELDPLAGFIRLYARERGHDGMVRPYDFGEGCRSDFVEYIAFEPGQVRLAIGN